MSEPLTEEPPIGSTIELTGDSLQAGWRYLRLSAGWVRVWSDGCIDATHPLPWENTRGHHPVLVEGPWYPDVNHTAHVGRSHVGGNHRPEEWL